ncbi:small, acid-soluble spore protein, alpha/beta type [Intestinimonas butyriciproducens]|nr:small, acid-soluble spore protein, alpha/beta type [Intestinimonas butyriciproducens]
MSSSNNSNQPVVPSAREALNKFKMEAAQDFDVSTSY